MEQKRFGILLTKSIELPYDNILDQKRDEKLNAEVAHLGFRIVNSANDFAFIETFADQSADFTKVERLESDTNISLFRTITEGTIRWEGNISLDRANYHHGYQRGLTEKEWVTMFHSTLPARLNKKDGRSLYGALEAFSETGTEGPIWMLSEFGKNGYGSLEGLDDGDKLTVFSCVFNGEIDWNGRLSFGEDSPFSIPLDKSANFKYQLMRKTFHMPTAQWMWLTFQNRPCVIY
jgi:hypothetical protein